MNSKKEKKGQHIKSSVKSVKDKDNLVKVTFHAPASLRKTFKIKAANEDLSIKDALCALMKAYIDNKIKLIGTLNVESTSI